MPTAATAKITTLEDIERNLIIQQAVPKQQLHQQHPQPLPQQDLNLINRQHLVSTATLAQHQQQLQKQPPQHKGKSHFIKK